MVAITSSIGDCVGTSTVKFTAFEVTAERATVTLPGIAVAGTLTTNSVVLPLMGVASAPLKCTVLAAGLGSKPAPESVTFTPTSALGGKIDASVSGGATPVDQPELPGFVSAVAAGVLIPAV